MAAYLTLYDDWFNKKLVKGLTDPGPFILPGFTEGEIIPLKIYMVKPNLGGISYAQENIGGSGLEAVVTSAPGGTVLAANYAFSQDTSDGNGFFYGELDLTSAALDSWLGSSTSKDAYFELRWSQGAATPIPYRTDKFTVYPRIVPVTQDTVVAGQTALSLEVANQKFVSKVMGNGETIMLKSPDGNVGLIIGVNNDKSITQDVITFT